MSSINDEVYVLLWALFVVDALVPDDEETYKQSLMILSEEGGEIFKIFPQEMFGRMALITDFKVPRCD